MKLTIAIAIAIIMLAIFISALAKDNPMGIDFDKAHPAYSLGVNDALDTLILLNLELQLKGERKTWGDMAEIVRKRLHVKKETK